MNERFCSDCPVKIYLESKILFEHTSPESALHKNMEEKLIYLAGERGIIYPDIPSNCDFPCELPKR